MNPTISRTPRKSLCGPRFDDLSMSSTRSTPRGNLISWLEVTKAICARRSLDSLMSRCGRFRKRFSISCREVVALLASSLATQTIGSPCSEQICTTKLQIVHYISLWSVKEERDFLWRGWVPTRFSRTATSDNERIDRGTAAA